MKHTYTTVRQQINELVPELLELKFGVEVEKSEMWNGVVVGEAYEQVAYLNYDKMQVFLAPAEEFKILGAEPQLHHVLKAISKSDISETAWTATITPDGWFMNRGGEAIVQWNMDESLSGQSEEVINFVGEVLSK